MIIGYARVSTRGQARTGNSLEDQVQKLKEAGATEIYRDAWTGTKRSRPGLDEALAKIEKGDTFMCCKLDRVARSISQGSELIRELIGKGVRVHILNIGIMDDTPASRLITNIFFAFAEFERDMIVERTQEGKEAAKEKGGYREGRPATYTDDQIGKAKRLMGRGMAIKRVSELTGIGESTIRRRVKK